MGKTIYSDNTDINGVNYSTVGENIREGAKVLTYESVETVLEENLSKMLESLNINGNYLRACILYLLTGKSSYPSTWGDMQIFALTEEDKQSIKTFLGIS